MSGLKQTLSHIWKEWNRPTAFRQWQNNKRIQAEMDQEYHEMFGDKPVLERYCEARIDREKITALVLNVTQDSADKSLEARIEILSNDSPPNSYEAGAYKVGHRYAINADRLTKIKDPEPPENDRDALEEKYALREYAEKYGL